MSIELYAEIDPHRSPFNGSGRHKGDQSIGSSQIDAWWARELASKHR